MPVSYASIAPQLHERYHDKAIQICVEEQNPKLSPLVAQLEMKPSTDVEEAFGRGYVIPITTGRGGAVSNTFSSSRSISYGTDEGHAATNDRWVVTPTTKHATANWEREALLRAANSEEKLYDTMSAEIDARLGKLKLRLAIDLFEAGYGRAATIVGTPVASPATVVVSASTINRFEIGDQLVAGATLTGALRSATALRVTGIDLDTYTLTLSASPLGLSWADGDTLFFFGDHTDSTLTAPVGLQGYIPDTAPTATLFGVTRSGIPATSGRRRNCASFDAETALYTVAADLTRSGAVPTSAHMSVADYMGMNLDKSRAKVVDVEVGKYNIGFSAVQLQTPGGAVNVFSEMLMEQGRFYMGDFKSVHAPFIIHTDDLINVDNFSGQELKDIDNATVYEMRWYSYLAIAFPGPGKFAVGYGLPA